MQITVVGGSKGTGALLAGLARDAGHDVTVLSRSGAAPEGVRSVTGDAADAASVAAAIEGADGVVVTVGGAKGVRHQRARVTQTVIDAMQETGVRRLVVQSSLGAGDSGSQMPAALRLVMKVALAGPLADHDEQERAVTASGLDWTIVRPTGLTDKPALCRWRVLQVSDPGSLGGTIPRADLAAFLLQVLDDDAATGKAYGISS